METMTVHLLEGSISFDINKVISVEVSGDQLYNHPTFQSMIDSLGVIEGVKYIKAIVNNQYTAMSLENTDMKGLGKIEKL